MEVLYATFVTRVFCAVDLLGFNGSFTEWCWYFGLALPEIGGGGATTG